MTLSLPKMKPHHKQISRSCFIWYSYLLNIVTVFLVNYYWLNKNIVLWVFEFQQPNFFRLWDMCFLWYSIYFEDFVCLSCSPGFIFAVYYSTIGMFKHVRFWSRVKQQNEWSNELSDHFFKGSCQVGAGWRRLVKLTVIRKESSAIFGSGSCFCWQRGLIWWTCCRGFYLMVFIF